MEEESSSADLQFTLLQHELVFKLLLCRLRLFVLLVEQV